MANLICLFGKGSVDWARFYSSIFLISSSPLYPHHAYYMPTWYLITLFWIALFYFALTRIFTKWALLPIGGISLISLWALSYQSSPIENYNLIIPWLNNGFIRGLACIGIGYCLSVFYTYRAFNIYYKWIFSLMELGLFIYIPLTLFDKTYEISLGSEILFFVLLYVLFLRHQGIFSIFFNKPLWCQFAKFTLPIFMTHDFIVPVMIYTNILEPFSLIVKLLILLSASALTGIVTYYMFQAAQICHRKIFK